MGRPKNKQELADLSSEYFQRLTSYINSMPEKIQAQQFKEGTMNRNIRDVLGHLHHWHQLFLEWYEAGMSGKKPDMPAKGYTWKMTPELNMAIRETYSAVPLEKVKRMLSDSFARIQAIIQKHTEQELFEKGRYGWTGSTSLGAYLVSATSSHYDWAYKLIKRCLK